MLDNIIEFYLSLSFVTSIHVLFVSNWIICSVMGCTILLWRLTSIHLEEVGMLLVVCPNSILLWFTLRPGHLHFCIHRLSTLLLTINCSILIICQIKRPQIHDVDMYLLTWIVVKSNFYLQIYHHPSIVWITSRHLQDYCFDFILYKMLTLLLSLNQLFTWKKFDWLLLLRPLLLNLLLIYL